MDSLFEAIDFVENPLYERIISDIANAHYSVIENFFSSDEVSILRTSLLAKHEEDAFKKAAIGNRTNEIIRASIRGDVILWIDEAKANLAETMFFDKINNLIAYLQAIIFITLGAPLILLYFAALASQSYAWDLGYYHILYSLIITALILNIALSMVIKGITSLIKNYKR